MIPLIGTNLLIAALLALVIGIVLGLLGGGGAILTLPMLIYILHVDPRAAIATSLFVVGASSVVGTVLHARARTVRWRVAAGFGGGAMAGAFAGGKLARHVPATLLLILFAIVMSMTGLAMLRDRASAVSPSVADVAAPQRIGLLLVLGAGVGVLSGLIGAGGGFLIVPALTMFGRLTMREAIGTSLAVISVQSFAGFAGQRVDVDWLIVGIVTTMATGGAVAGALATHKVPAEVLRRGFAWFVIVMGLALLHGQTRNHLLTLIVGIGVLLVALRTSFEKKKKKKRRTHMKNNEAAASCKTSLPSPR